MYDHVSRTPAEVVYELLNKEILGACMTKQMYDHVSRTPAEVKIRSNFEVVHLLQICLNKAVVHLLHYK